MNNHCCKKNPYTPPKRERWMTGYVETPMGKIPRVATQLVFYDTLGTIKVRLALGRNNYIIAPGLYAIGNPTAESPIFVSANYKLSFDRLRSALAGIHGWILVLDTKGINVWCAAGKGTFGTKEIVSRVQKTKLNKVVSHRKLIVPQLGAPGVSTKDVAKQCEFQVIYGPVRANDLPKFIEFDFKAKPEMRRVHFTLLDRIAVIPVELVIWFKHTLGLAILIGLLSGFSKDGYSLANVPRAFGLVFAGWMGGGVLIPILLPWLPGRAFSIKGLWVALALTLVLSSSGLLGTSALAAAGWGAVLVAIVTFMALNFTGTSTYTSLSGVKKEMKVAIPVQMVTVLLGVICIIWGGLL